MLELAAVHPCVGLTHVPLIGLQHFVPGGQSLPPQVSCPTPTTFTFWQKHVFAIRLYPFRQISIGLHLLLNPWQSPENMHTSEQELILQGVHTSRHGQPLSMTPSQSLSIKSPHISGSHGSGVAVGAAVGVAGVGVAVGPARTGVVSPKNITREAAVISRIAEMRMYSTSGCDG